jgi:UDP-glucose:(heptosyl)LPS alpha-1,3-glucosyltransferase
MKSDARKKIAVVIPKYGLLGGAENHTAELTNRIAQNEQYDVHVFANQWTNHSENITFHKVPIISFPKFLTTISFAYFAGLRMSPIHFDIIHTHERIFSADICTLHGLPHSTWVKEVRKKRINSLFDYGTIWVEKKFVNNNGCRKHIAVSNLAKEKFLQGYPNVDSSEVRVIHPGVDIEKFTKLDRQTCRHEVRQNLGIGMEEIVIIFVSMNYDIKGLDYLMMGLSIFKGRHPKEKFKLLIVGKSNNGKYVSLAEKTGIQDNVLYTGAIPYDHIAKFYLASDIFSMPSRFDTFGLTVLEAMAASLPVIVSANVGAKDIVKQGINGFIIDDARNRYEIAYAIELLWNKDIRMRMSKAALIIASHYSWERTAEKYCDLYNEIGINNQSTSP